MPALLPRRLCHFRALGRYPLPPLRLMAPRQLVQPPLEHQSLPLPPLLRHGPLALLPLPLPLPLPLHPLLPRPLHLPRLQLLLLPAVQLPAG